MHTDKQIAAARIRASKLAALADPARNDNEAERAVSLSKLIELCGKFGFDLADFVKPVASPDAEPAADASDADKRAAAYRANFAFTAQRYSGASKPATKNPKLAKLLENVVVMPQRVGPRGLSDRDIAQLLNNARYLDAAGTFCPVAANSDAGCISRGASAGLYVLAGDRIGFTDLARERLANAQRKAA